MTEDSLLTIARMLASGIWIMVGLFKLAHLERMTDVVRRHGIPFPRVALWLSIVAELGGAILVLASPFPWVGYLIWLVFLVVSTPIFHGRAIVGGQIDYPQYVQIGKNLSIAGGIIALMILDETFRDFFPG